MVYKCNICKKEFKHKYLLEKHNNRKYPCRSVNTIEINDKLSKLEEDVCNLKEKYDSIQTQLSYHSTDKINELECKFCHKSFSFKNNLYRHLRDNKCRSKNDNVFIYERELGIVSIEQIKNKCKFCLVQYTTKQAYSRHMNKGCNAQKRYEDELRERVLENRRAAAAHITNNTTNNNNNTIVINMPNIPQMRAFGQENVDYMTTKLLLKELESYKQLQTADIGNIVNKFTQLMHGNPAHPENHNVLFKSLNSGYARIYNGTNFEDRQSTEVQDEIISRVGPMIGKVCDEASLENEKETITDALDEIDSRMSNMISSSNDGKDTRQLSRCRNAVKAALHTHTIEIKNTQQLI